MHAALAWLEGSALGEWVRTSGPWTYAVVNLGHVFGIALLFGAVVVLDLRLLGLWRAAPVAAVVRPTLGVAAAGLALAIPTGVTLLSAQATEYARNPFLWIKLSAVALGVLNVLALRRSAAWRALGDEGRMSPTLAWAAAVSLACWLTAVSAGRLIAYW